MITPSDREKKDNEVSFGPDRELPEDETDYSFPEGKEFIPHNID